MQNIRKGERNRTWQTETRKSERPSRSGRCRTLAAPFGETLRFRKYKLPRASRPVSMLFSFQQSKARFFKSCTCLNIHQFDSVWLSNLMAIRAGNWHFGMHGLAWYLSWLRQLLCLVYWIPCEFHVDWVEVIQLLLDKLPESSLHAKR